MDVAFACPADGSVLLVSRGGYDCPTCGQHFPVERGVVRFLAEEDRFYEGRYLYTIRYLPRSERWWHVWPLWLVNAGYLWAVRRHVSAGSDVLEMGCAGGVAYFGQRYRLIGLDLSLTSLAEMATAYEAVVQADVTKRIPLPDASIDAVISSFVWEHIPPADKPAALREIARVLRPGGKLVFLFDVDCASPLYRWLRRSNPAMFQKTLIEGDGHFGWESPEANRRSFEAGGFEVLALEGRDKLLIGPDVWEKVSHWGGWAKRLSTVGCWFGRGPQFQLYNALQRVVDATVARLFPLRWSRVVIGVCRKRP